MDIKLPLNFLELENVKLLSVIVAAAFLFCLSKRVSGAVPIDVVVTTGEDWSFPQEIEKSQISGFFQMGDDNPQRDIPDDLAGLINCYAVTLTWAALNPAEGVYDYSELEDALQTAENDGKCLVVRLKNHVVNRNTPWGVGDIPFIPQWVLNKHQPTRFYTYGPDSAGYLIEVAAPWDEGVTQEYLTFIENFGQQDILGNTSLKGIYVTGFSTSAGEEMWLDATGANNAAAAGMTPENFQSAYEDRLRGWAAAAGPFTGKMVWVGAGNITSPDGTNYQPAREALDSLAATLGVGIRSGGMETYSAAYSWEWGLQYDATSEKMHRNPDWKFRDFKRYLGGEDESFPDLEAYDPWFRSSVWIEALVGSGFLWLPPRENNGLIRRNADLLNWFALRAGKSLSRMPDAVAWLREGYFQVGYSCNTVKNIEIGLYQNDGAGQDTVAAMFEDRSGLAGGSFSYDCEGMHYDYLARRTDTANGNSNMSFTLDNTFQNTSGRFQVKVMYLDNSSARWKLVTPSNSSISVQNSGSGAIKTATFSLGRDDLQTTFADGSDFRLDVQEGGDLTVTILRVIKDDPVGDIDHSGKVDLPDAIIALQTVAGVEPVVPVYLESIESDRIGLADAIIALKVVSEME